MSIKQVSCESQEKQLSFQIRINKNRILLKKKVLNDYIEIVNKRKEIVDSIQSNMDGLGNLFNFIMVFIDQVSSETFNCFSKYYSKESFFKQQIENLFTHLSPQYQYIKQQYVAYQSRSQSSPTIDSKPSKIKIVKAQRSQFDKIMALSGINQANETQNQDILKDFSYWNQSRQSQFEQQAILARQKSDQMKVQLQSRLIKHEMKCMGDDIIKRKIFTKNMMLMKQGLTDGSPTKQKQLNKLRATNPEIDEGLSQFNKASIQPSQQRQTSQTQILTQDASPLSSQGFSPIFMKSPNRLLSKSQALSEINEDNLNCMSILRKLPNQEDSDKIKRSIYKGIKVIYVKKEQEKLLIKQKEHEEELHNLKVQDVFKHKKNHSVQMDKFFYSNKKLKSNLEKDQQLYLKVVDPNAKIQKTKFNQGLFDDQDFVVESKVQSQIRPSVISQVSQGSLEYSQSMIRLNSDVIEQYNSLQSSCQDLQQQNNKIRRKIRRSITNSEKKFNELKLDNKIKTENKFNKFREIMGSNYPLNPNQVSQFQVLQEQLQKVN